MSKHIVEDVGLGQVIQTFQRTDHNGGGEPSRGQAGEERFGGDVARNWNRVPAGTRLEPSVQLLNVGDAVGFEANRFGAIQIHLRSPFGEVRHLLGVELAPCFLVVLGVAVVSLVDEHRLDAFVTWLAIGIGGGLGRLRLLIINHGVVEGCRIHTISLLP